MEEGEKKCEYTSGPNQVMATDKLMTWDVISAVTVRMGDSPPANTPPFSVPTLMMKVAGQAAKLPALKVRIEEFEVRLGMKTSVNLDKKYGRDISRLSWTLKENKAGKVGITQSLNQCNCEDILLSNMTRRIYICIIKRHKSTKNTIQQLDDWVCCLN